MNLLAAVTRDLDPWTEMVRIFCGMGVIAFLAAVYIVKRNRS